MTVLRAQARSYRHITVFYHFAKLTEKSAFCMPMLHINVV